MSPRWGFCLGGIVCSINISLLWSFLKIAPKSQRDEIFIELKRPTKQELQRSEIYLLTTLKISIKKCSSGA